MGNSEKRRRREAFEDEEVDRSHRKASRYDLAEFGVRDIDDEDFYQKSTQFKVWLLEERDTHFDKLSSEEAHRLFDRRFAKAWNKGKLDRKYYDGTLVDNVAPSSLSSHAWSIKRTDEEKAIAQETLDRVGGRGVVVGRSVRGPVQGPTRPPPPSTLEELQERREADREATEARRDYERSRYKKEIREERQEVRDNRATGRDRLMEKRSEKREGNRAFADRNDGAAPEIDEDTLMGGGDSFRAALAARDRVKQRPSKRQLMQEERVAELNDRRSQFRAKEDATIAMFKQLAQSRFGS